MKIANLTSGPVPVEAIQPSALAKYPVFAMTSGDLDYVKEEQILRSVEAALRELVAEGFEGVIIRAADAVTASALAAAEKLPITVFTVVGSQLISFSDLWDRVTDPCGERFLDAHCPA